MKREIEKKVCKFIDNHQRLVRIIVLGFMVSMVLVTIYIENH